MKKSIFHVFFKLFLRRVLNFQFSQKKRSSICVKECPSTLITNQYELNLIEVHNETTLVFFKNITEM